MILDGDITDQKALVQALPYLVDITRLEEGKHTNATLHATMTGGEAMERIRAIREQAGTVTPELDAPTEPEATSTDGQPLVAGGENPPHTSHERN